MCPHMGCYPTSPAKGEILGPCRILLSTNNLSLSILAMWLNLSTCWAGSPPLGSLHLVLNNQQTTKWLANSYNFSQHKLQFQAPYIFKKKMNYNFKYTGTHKPIRHKIKGKPPNGFTKIYNTYKLPINHNWVYNKIKI